MFLNLLEFLLYLGAFIQGYLNLNKNRRNQVTGKYFFTVWYVVWNQALNKDLKGYILEQEMFFWSHIKPINVLIYSEYKVLRGVICMFVSVYGLISYAKAKIWNISAGI